MAVAQTIETTNQQRTTPTPARKGLAHKLEHPPMVWWLKITDPDEIRDALAKQYIKATEQYRAMLRREPEIVAELKATNREITQESGTKLDKAIRRQSALIAELGMIEDFRVEATQAHIDASTTLGAYLERQTLRDANAATDAINATAAERDRLTRIVNTLPKPDNHDAAKARLREVQEELVPIQERRNTCTAARRIAQSMQYDRTEATRLIERARKGRS